MQGDLTTVLAVDDHDGFRATLRELVEATSGFELVGEATSGEQAVWLVAQLEPDVVLLDVHMPGEGGIAAAREIVGARPDSVVALISGKDVADLPADAWNCGAHAVLGKDVLRPQVLARLRECAREGRPEQPLTAADCV